MITTELISALKIKGSFPSSNDLFSDDDFLVLLNMAMHVEINPLMLRLNEEYFLEPKDFEITQGGTYRLPRRIISLRNLSLVDGNGNETPLDRNFEEDRPGNRSGYYLLRNSIQLSNDISSGTLRMRYFARPSKLVLPTAAGQIESIDTGTNQVVVTAAPATFTTGTLVDFVQDQNPYDLLSLDQSLSNISGTTLTFASLPDDLEEGDWVTLANESPVPLVPEELHTVLVQAALVTSLSSKKDKALEVEAAVLEKMKESVISLLDPRVQNNSVKMRAGKLHRYFASGRG